MAKDIDFKELLKTRGLAEAQAALASRKKELAGEKARLETQLQNVDAQLTVMDTQFATATREAFADLGIPLFAQKKGGKMTEEEKASMVKLIVDHVNASGSTGIARSGLLDKLGAAGLTPPDSTLSATLTALVKDKKIARKGDRKTARYYSAK